jgi:hypothetical protein
MQHAGAFQAVRYREKASQLRGMAGSAPTDQLLDRFTILAVQYEQLAVSAERLSGGIWASSREPCALGRKAARPACNRREGCRRDQGVADGRHQCPQSRRAASCRDQNRAAGEADADAVTSAAV